MTDYRFLGKMATKVRNLELKEIPDEYDDTELRSLMSSQADNYDAKIANLQSQIDNLRVMLEATNYILHQIVAGNGLQLPDNVLVSDD